MQLGAKRPPDTTESPVTQPLRTVSPDHPALELLGLPADQPVLGCEAGLDLLRFAASLPIEIDELCITAVDDELVGPGCMRGRVEPQVVGERPEGQQQRDDQAALPPSDPHGRLPGLYYLGDAHAKRGERGTDQQEPEPGNTSDTGSTADACGHSGDRDDRKITPDSDPSRCEHSRASASPSGQDHHPQVECLRVHAPIAPTGPGPRLADLEGADRACGSLRGA